MPASSTLGLVRIERALPAAWPWPTPYCAMRIGIVAPSCLLRPNELASRRRLRYNTSLEAASGHLLDWCVARCIVTLYGQSRPGWRRYTYTTVAHRLPLGCLFCSWPRVGGRLTSR